MAANYFPDPVKEDVPFLYWCTDLDSKTRYNPKEMNPSKGNVLHALRNETTKYTVTFMDDGNVIKSESLSPGSPIVYPDEPTKTGHTFGGWNSGITEMPDHDITISATFTKNNYTVTFIFNNGVSPDVRTLSFNDPIVYPNAPVKDGFTFNGWDKIVTTVPAENITITAQWNVTKASEYVEIVLSQKGLSKDEVKEIIKGYVSDGEEFTIKNIESDSNGTKVIIKFVDREKATNFFEQVGTSSETKSIIRKIGFAYNFVSFSIITRPFSLLFFISSLFNLYNYDN